MSNIYRLLVFVFLCHLGNVSYAAPNSENWGHYPTRVHAPIYLSEYKPQLIRYAILQASLHNKGSVSWLLEELGDDFVTVRLDYRDDAIIQKIRFDKQAVWLEYVDANGFECKKLIDGVCHKNRTKYFHYSKTLRVSIQNQLRSMLLWERKEND